MPMIKQNDIIDVIYDSIYGYSLEEAFKILEDHRKGAYIPIEWIEKWFSQFYGEQGLEWNKCKRFMLEDWEKENDKDSE